MADSVWSNTLEHFRERVATLEPVPAGVTIAAISAALALALLSKVLQVTRKRKDFAGDAELIASLMDDTRKTSDALSRLADDDVAVYHEYLECLRSKQPAGGAIRRTIEVPLDVARTASHGIALCDKASGHVHKVVAPDLGIAAGLLAGVVRSTLVTVNANIGQLPANDPYREQASAEAHRLAI
jgi:methenyltetrahydrofolate cyclohydrolase